MRDVKSGSTGLFAPDVPYTACRVNDDDPIAFFGAVALSAYFGGIVGPLAGSLESAWVESIGGGATDLSGCARYMAKAAINTINPAGINRFGDHDSETPLRWFAPDVLPAGGNGPIARPRKLTTPAQSEHSVRRIATG
jgi:hypothetical protein